MNNIIINEENKEMYKSYLSLQTYQSKKDLYTTAILSIGTVAIGFFSTSFISSSILSNIICGLSVISPFPIVGLREKYRIARNKKKFKAQYPNFDATLSINEIEIALDKYNESVQVQEMLLEDTSFMKKTPEEKVNVVNGFMRMRNAEKVTFLEKEKEFWQQDKQRNMSEEQAIQKKIGERK